MLLGGSVGNSILVRHIANLLVCQVEVVSMALCPSFSEGGRGECRVLGNPLRRARHIGWSAFQSIIYLENKYRRNNCNQEERNNQKKQTYMEICRTNGILLADGFSWWMGFCAGCY